MVEHEHYGVVTLEIILALLALVLALVHAIDLKKLVGAFSTVYKSRFPSYLNDVSKLIENAGKSIFILCDLPAYGVFSNNKSFVKYKLAIEEKIEAGIPVHLTCLSPSRRREALTQQFEAQWKNKSAHFSILLRSFHAKYHEKDAEYGDDIEKFLKDVEDINIDLLRYVFHDKYNPIEQHMPIFFWLVDDKEAIFAIPCNNQKIIEYGFSTRDSRLIKGFKEMHDLFIATDRKEHLASPSALS